MGNTQNNKFDGLSDYQLKQELMLTISQFVKKQNYLINKKNFFVMRIKLTEFCIKIY